MKSKTNTVRPTFSLNTNERFYKNLIESEQTRNLVQDLTYLDYYNSLNEKLKIKEYQSLTYVAELHLKLCKTMSNCEYTLSDVQCSNLVYGILKDMIDMYQYPDDVRLITKCNSSIRELIDVTYKNLNNIPLELRVTSAEFPRDLRIAFSKFSPGAHGNIIESIRSIYYMYMAIDLCVTYLNNKLINKETYLAQK